MCVLVWEVSTEERLPRDSRIQPLEELVVVHPVALSHLTLLLQLQLQEYCTKHTPTTLSLYWTSKISMLQGLRNNDLDPEPTLTKTQICKVVLKIVVIALSKNYYYTEI